MFKSILTTNAYWQRVIRHFSANGDYARAWAEIVKAWKGDPRPGDQVILELIQDLYARLQSRKKVPRIPDPTFRAEHLKYLIGNKSARKPNAVSILAEHFRDQKAEARRRKAEQEASGQRRGKVPKDTVTIYDGRVIRVEEWSTFDSAPFVIIEVRQQPTGLFFGTICDPEHGGRHKEGALDEVLLSLFHAVIVARYRELFALENATAAAVQDLRGFGKYKVRVLDKLEEQH